MFDKRKDKKSDSFGSITFDKSAMRVILLASIVIILSVLIMGAASYIITNNAIVDKLKSKDLTYIAESISSKIEGRISRAEETSRILARDPSIIKWVEDGETDETLGKYALQKITDIASSYDYSNSFIVSAVTNHYWAEGGKLIDTMTKSDPDDSWFFDTIASKRSVTIQIDYNNERKDTFVFIDALMGDLNKPIAVTGIGLNFKDISEEFQSYKFGEMSNLWLIDSKGNIYISEDLNHVQKNISDFLPSDISRRIVSNPSGNALGSVTFDYVNKDNQVYDLIYQPIKSTDWKLVLQIPRSESISVVNSIKINTIAASFIIIILIVLIFYFVSKRIADPYKRAVLLNRELEKMVSERTEELNEKNIKIMDSIEYAKLIQESILPSSGELQSIFKEHFIIWRPRDIVGGDFYWAKEVEGGYLAAVGDCTGHGVPGALMTMTVNSILNHITDKICSDNPALILQHLNGLLKATLHRKDADRIVDDGLTIGVIYISQYEMVFSGARLSLYMKDSGGLQLIKGNNKSIGYRSTPDTYEFSNNHIRIDEGSVCYMTTDGFTDQNGGEKNYSLGRKRFEAIINECYLKALPEQKHIFEERLKAYMAGEEQRDDITVLGFRLR